MTVIDRDPITKRFIGTGKRIDKHGYVNVIDRNRKQRGKNWPYSPEHVLIYERYHNCCMLKWGRVHHKNHSPSDNRIENLQGMTNSQHLSLHSLKDMSDRKCLECGSTATLVHKGYANWHKMGNGFICRHCYDHRNYLARRQARIGNRGRPRIYK